MGYFCVDNLPPTLITRMSELSTLPGSNITKVALVCDVRGGEFFSDLQKELTELRGKGINYRVLYLQASDDVLQRRFKETRRRHPLAKYGTVSDGIAKEKEALQGVKGEADVIIDTSNMKAQDLRNRLRQDFGDGGDKQGLAVNVVSFGYKYGTPPDADLVIDVRFLPNPHYIPELKPLTGKDTPVRDFVLGRGETQEFLKRFFALLEFLLPGYVSEGKSYLTIAMGCTGGRHRSVALADSTSAFLNKAGYRVSVRHRDVDKDPEAK